MGSTSSSKIPSSGVENGEVGSRSFCMNSPISGSLAARSLRPRTKYPAHWLGANLSQRDSGSENQVPTSLLCPRKVG
jgi:hypothetical protein